tara:strand:- start:125 stop:688 length:564 start_codon:yes stop_codon:yes gene_type:complete
MKLIFVISIFFLLVNCGKPKTVLICGDHVCINKAEAKQFFEENFTIEVKILDKKMKKKIDLVELNLRDDQKGSKSISITSKMDNNRRLKTLSNNEIIEIKKRIKNKTKEKKYTSKKNMNNKDNIKINEKKNNSKHKELLNENVNKNKIDVADICTILENCSIDEISKYLLKKGKNKDFPDITKRQLN